MEARRLAGGRRRALVTIRFRRIGTVALALAVSVVLTAAPPGRAHAGGATFDVRTARADGMTVQIDVRVTYAADGDPAEAAFLTAVPVAPDGRRLAPVEFVRGEAGTYTLETTVDTRGEWTFVVTSRFPPGSTDVRIRVASPARDDEDPPVPTEGSSDSGSTGWLIGGIVAGTVVVVLAAVVLYRRRWVHPSRS
jgi:hypothetical protein